jgi:hypothetical protein
MYFISAAIPKHAGSEAEGSNPAIELWARNPFRGNFKHWQVSQKEAGRFSLNDNMDVKKVSRFNPYPANVDNMVSSH